jgi:Transmembrane secretion effector
VRARRAGTAPGGGGKGGLFAPLRHRRYRLLFTGQMLSGFGDWVDYVALLALVAYEMHAGPTGLAAVSLAMTVPWIVLGPVSGVWADRLPQRPTMIACDLLRAALVLGYLAAPGLGVLVALVLLKTSVSTLFGPAQQSAVRLVVPEKDLLGASALGVTIGQSAKIAGPAIGAVLLAVASPDAAFVVDAATFAASALILSWLRLPPRTATGEAERRRGGFRRELGEGLAYVAGNRTLRTAVTGLSATVFLVLAFDTLSPLILARLGLGQALYGFAIGFVGAGALLGTAAVGQWGLRWNPFAVLGLSQLATGGCVAAMGTVALLRLAPPAGIWMPFVLVIGFCSAGILVIFGYLVQHATPQRLIGRVGAVVTVVPSVLQVAAPTAGAALASTLGTGWVLGAAGAGLAVLGACGLVARPQFPPPDGTPPEPARETGHETGDKERPHPPRPEAAREAERSGHIRNERKGRDMAYNAIEALRQAGHSLENVPAEKMAVLAALTPQEVDVLNSVKSRLDDEVTAHSTAPTEPGTTVGAVVW